MRKIIILSALVVAAAVMGFITIADDIGEIPLSEPISSSSPSPAYSVQPTKSVSPTPVSEANILIRNVPFTPQAPTGNWSDERQQDGCEESSALMAVAWAKNEKLPTSAEVEKKIIAISNYEQQIYGEFHSTNVSDTVERIFKGYLKYNNVEARYNIDKNDIIDELKKGNLVIVPLNGQKIGNPYYTPPGPLEHELVIKGYDPAKDQFITNDPGTRRGENYHYPANTLMAAIYDYPTGHREPVSRIIKAMIVVSR
ncbi:MAG: hypothetical protein A2657_00865 [Candidatus Yanofskybacteria bacterium RIFCSPHIGHO2_01_FULL_44_110b]|nr:MAG: hypothetical protein A2657_00865 [Candidatus Yanofskybacteria bacterium RIFCSPHIGHO2_01_FULL_44_110b]OGN14244.1 MAG: hypothetical protein A3C01_01455 [Candidatus Yanofskybacteria bacterium RIFCSPHIGHO2_02_FULL_44_36b]OGN27122.1 MAG: hypothetical protein A3B12_02055 [Candidatus Yanofskybacteria bacterium RIFCSPLOWO2_01_FULL_44_88]